MNGASSAVIIWDSFSDGRVVRNSGRYIARRVERRVDDSESESESHSDSDVEETRSYAETDVE
jgi:hypothetical protein